MAIVESTEVVGRSGVQALDVNKERNVDTTACGSLILKA